MAREQRKHDLAQVGALPRIRRNPASRPKPEPLIDADALEAELCGSRLLDHDDVVAVRVAKHEHERAQPRLSGGSVDACPLEIGITQALGGSAYG